jgi:L-amino acid N-acyltransferase YncA
VSAAVTVRAAVVADWPAVAAIVNHYIAATTVNFRTRAADRRAVDRRLEPVPRALPVACCRRR